MKLFTGESCIDVKQPPKVVVPLKLYFMVLLIKLKHRRAMKVDTQSVKVYVAD